MNVVHSNAGYQMNHNSNCFQAVHNALRSAQTAQLQPVFLYVCVCVLTSLSAKHVQQGLRKPHLRLAHVVQDLHGILPVAELCIGAQQSHICHDVWLQPGCVHVIKHLLHLHEYSSNAEAHTSYLIPHTLLSRRCPFLISIKQ